MYCILFEGLTSLNNYLLPTGLPVDDEICSALLQNRHFYRRAERSAQATKGAALVYI